MNIFAHRGFSGLYPENTMLAFTKANDTNCYGIELDVQLSKDNKVVIIHDETLERTTNGKGYVRNLTLTELKKLNAAKLFPQFGFQEIPSLEEYLKWVKHTNIVTNIEIKSNQYFYNGLEENVVSLVQQHQVEKSVIISSFNVSSLHLIKSLNKTIPCALLVDNSNIENIGTYCKKFNFDYYHPSYKSLSENIIKDCKDHHISINTWTINDMSEINKIKKWNIDGIITNFPNIF